MMQSRWETHISRLQSGLDLETEDVQWCMNEILTGNANLEVIKEFLLALKSKGETSEEVGALVAQMYQHCAPISINKRAVDTVGTGGDGAHTINISTTAAIIAAAAGAKARARAVALRPRAAGAGRVCVAVSPCAGCGRAGSRLDR